MARLPYADLNAADVRPLAEKIIQQRGSVLHLYQMLMHSAPLADGWLTFLTAIRQKCSLAGSLRELVIMRVAILNGAQYEADQHAPIARNEGVTDQQLADLAQWEASNSYSAKQRAVLALTDSMTRDIKVPDAIMDEARRHFSDKETVELVATIAAYNMVSRFLEALDIHSHDER